MNSSKIKLALASLAIFSLFFFSNINTQACPSGYEQGKEPIQIPFGPDCYMEFDYCYLLHVTGIGGQTHKEWDVLVSEIRFVGDCNDPHLDFDMNPSTYFELAYQAVFMEDDNVGYSINEMTIPPCPAVVSLSLNCGHPSCYSTAWVSTYDQNISKWVLTKTICSDLTMEDACWTSFTVCIEYVDNMPVLNFTATTGNAGPNDCGEDCTFICE